MRVYSEEQVQSIERCIIELLEKKRESQNVSRVEWGRRCYEGECANPQAKIQAIVGKNTVGGKPKRISVGDLIKLSQALEADPAHVLAAVLLAFPE